MSTNEPYPPPPFEEVDRQWRESHGQCGPMMLSTVVYLKGEPRILVSTCVVGAFMDEGRGGGACIEVRAFGAGPAVEPALDSWSVPLGGPFGLDEVGDMARRHAAMLGRVLRSRYPADPAPEASDGE